MQDETDFSCFILQENCSEGEVIIRLVFVEGVSGVGKSTTAVKLRDYLNDLGFRAVCYLEGDPNNPVDLYSCAYLSKTEFSQLMRSCPNEKNALLKHSIEEADYVLVRYGDRNAAFFDPPLFDMLKSHEGFYRPAEPISIERYTQVFVDCWRRFLGRDLSSIDFVIFDGSFLYHRANDLTVNYNSAEDIIAAHLEALLASMSPHSPLIFYLSSEDVGRRLIEARISRGQEAATEERLAFEAARKHSQLKILKMLPIKARIFDISSGWEKALFEMMGIIMGDSK